MASDGWRTGNVWCFYRSALEVTLAVNLGTKATCWNIRSAPSASAAVSGCIPFGSRASIDGTPTYQQPASSDFQPTWWHVQDRGWINGLAICRADPCVGD